MSWTNEKYVDTRKSDVHGQMGGFAREFIPADTLLGVFSGGVFIVPVGDDGTLSLKQFGLRFNDIIQICRFEDKIICLSDGGSAPDKIDWTGIDYLNHSCEPNCAIRSSIQMWSLADIEKGRELVFDYREKDIIPEGIECWCDSDRKCVI